ncbi:4916_t:CDS:2, partial [Racocetra persica]
TLTLITTKSFPGSSDNNNVTNTQNSSSLYTYITPATYTFGILFPIYFLLAIFVIYQWFITGDGYDLVIDGVSYYFIIAAVLNIAIAYICLTIDLYYHTRGFFDNLFIRVPFSLWGGFALYTTILCFWIAIPALDTVLLSVIALAILIIFGLLIAEYYPFADSNFAIAILWVLIGIADYQIKVFPVLTVAILGCGLVTGGILRTSFSGLAEHKS